MKMRIPALALLLLIGATARAEKITEPCDFALDAKLDYRARRLHPVTYDVDFSVVVTAPYKTKVLKVWLPLPPSNYAQQVSRRSLDTFPQRVEAKIGREKVYCNQFAYFEFHNPQGGQIIRHRFRATVWELRWDLQPARVEKVKTWPKSFAAYLKPRADLAADESFQKTLQQITPQTTGKAAGLFAAMNWIDRNLTYDHVAASLRADSLKAFQTRRGHCSDYHGLCATMGRSLGYPTRVTYGLTMFAKQSPSHCKLEAFLPPYGWVSFDLSETQEMVKRIAENKQLSEAKKEHLSKAARRRLLGGFRDNTWLLVTQGTNYQLEPPASQAAAVVRTIYAEADGVALPDPDPANKNQREFSWMTVVDIQADKQVKYPFKDLGTLGTKLEIPEE